MTTTYAKNKIHIQNYFKSPKGKAKLHEMYLKIAERKKTLYRWKKMDNEFIKKFPDIDIFIF